MSGFGACRTLLEVSLIHLVVNSLSQLKYILGLADQRVHASTFECVRLCSEGKIKVDQPNPTPIVQDRARQWRDVLFDPYLFEARPRNFVFL